MAGMLNEQVLLNSLETCRKVTRDGFLLALQTKLVNNILAILSERKTGQLWTMINVTSAVNGIL